MASKLDPKRDPKWGPDLDLILDANLDPKNLVARSAGGVRKASGGYRGRIGEQKIRTLRVVIRHAGRETGGGRRIQVRHAARQPPATNFSMI